MSSPTLRIIDIYHGNKSRRDLPRPDELRGEILPGLRKPAGQKHLPTVLLYDEEGLRLYDIITTSAPEYYLFSAEESTLHNHAHEIVAAMHGDGPTAGEVVLELGAGALRKTSHILQALSGLVHSSSTPAPITYYALDLEKSELERTLGQLATSDVGKALQGKVDTKGLCATYDSGLKFVQEGGLEQHPIPDTWAPRHYHPLKVGRDSSSSSRSAEERNQGSDDTTTTPSTPDAVQPPLHILFLGSSLGNFSRGEDADFLRSLPLRPGFGDTLLLGMDQDNGREKIEIAYNDPAGHTRRFIMNGLTNASRILGDEKLFDQDNWEYVNFYNEVERRHEAYYRSKGSQTLRDPATNEEFSFLPDELLKIEVSHKYSDMDAYTLFTEANLRPIQRWTDSDRQYSLWLLERPAFLFPLLSSPSRIDCDGPHLNVMSPPFCVPTIKDWQIMWTAWDHITLGMIPPSMLFQKPIDLRHICLFYLGHIPTFLDIHLSRLLKEPHSEPKEFKDIFERGIDPDVNDPSKCNPHSAVPGCDKDWPSLASILDFRNRARGRLLKLYEDLSSSDSSEALSCTSNKRVMNRRIGRVLFMTYEHEAWHAETLLYMLLQRAGTGTIPPTGFSPPSWGSLVASWNSAPVLESTTVTLGPATVSLGHDDLEADDFDPKKAESFDGHEFGWDNENPKRDIYVGEFRIEWRPITNGQYYEFYKGAGEGKVKLPASWVEEGDEVQVRTLYGPVSMDIAQHWPVVASYNELSIYALVKGGRIPTEPELRIFYDKFIIGYAEGANIGFRNWHPIPSTTGGQKDGGRGHNGGVWEWTSTLFDKVDGFMPSELYPGYSMDFFDEHHHVVIGGSYATIPRIAERRSVRNWYQNNYPYPWAGARLVYDLKAAA